MGYLMDIRLYLSDAIQPEMNKARAAFNVSFWESGCNAGTGKLVNSNYLALNLGAP